MFGGQGEDERRFGSRKERPVTVELYFFQPLGTNSGRVYLALLEKGVDFIEHELSGRDFEHLQPAYLAVNPKGQVPTLVHDGAALPEGMLINEYIDEAFEGPPLRPADPRERWRMRWWARYAENDLGRSLMMINWNRVVPSFAGDRSPEEMKAFLEKSVPDPDRRRSWLSAFEQRTDPARIEESHRRTRDGARKVDAHLRAHRWMAGESFSLADIDLFCFCGFMTSWMPDVVNERDTPAWMAWHSRMSERPAVKEMRARTKMNFAPPAGQSASEKGTA
jgi:glutathione S-transferase/GST-like protein